MDEVQDIVETGQFDFSRTVPGESDGGPMNWIPPTVQDKLPSEFASELVDSGELIDLSSMGTDAVVSATTSDPLRGCRYIAALELAQEPRVRRALRNMYRKYAKLTTRPTKKGIEEIDRGTCTSGIWFCSVAALFVGNRPYPNTSSNVE